MNYGGERFYYSNVRVGIYQMSEWVTQPNNVQISNDFYSYSNELPPPMPLLLNFRFFFFDKTGCEYVVNDIVTLYSM